ncbi:MAG: ABC transporter permease [bacterium]
MFLQYIARRLINMVPIVVAVIFLTFVFLKLAPGDFFSTMVLDPRIPETTVERLRREFGLDQPVHVQFLKWFWNALHLNFGYSFKYNGMPVFSLIRERMFNTLVLSLSSMFIAWALAIPIGIYSAVKQYSIGDKLATIFAFWGMSIPNYILAFIVMYYSQLFGLTEILPIGGVVGQNYDRLSMWGKLFDRIRHLIVPAFVLGTGGMAGLMRVMRGNLLEMLHAQFIMTARAKGLQEKIVILRHAVRNAINPIITGLGFAISAVLSGSVLVETVTSWPGMGRLTVEALLSQDYFLTIGSVLMATVLLIIGNLIADILLAVSDPRIQLS